MSDEKVCPRCESVQPLGEFTSDIRRDDGLSLYCRTCNGNRLRDAYTVKGPHGVKTEVVEIDGRRTKVIVLDTDTSCAHELCRSHIPAGSYVFPARNRPDLYCSAVCRSRHQAVLKQRIRQADPVTREHDNHVRRMTKYGISTEEYERLYDLQLGRCGICLTPLTETKKIHVDHHHETGVVRGLLCNLCNPGLGFFQDDIHILERAVAYLRASKSSGSASASDVVVGEGV